MRFEKGKELWTTTTTQSKSTTTEDDADETTDARVQIPPLYTILEFQFALEIYPLRLSLLLFVSK